MPLTYHDAGSALGKLRECSLRELMLLVGDAERGYKTEAMEILLAGGLEANYPALEAAVRDNDDADLRNGAMEVLVKFGRLSVPRLTRLLRDADEELRNFSAVMLGDIGNREAVGPLVQALGDPDSNVSHSAAEALGKIGDRAALEPLVELLKGEFWLQFPAITAMAALRDYRAVPHLLQLLGDELLAVPVAEALGKIGDPRALRPLACLLPDADDALAEVAARAMVAVTLNVKEVANYKNSLAEYSHPEQLRDLVAPGGVEKLKKLLRGARDRETVQAAATLLGWLGECSALDDLFRLLEDEAYLQAVESAILSIGSSAEGALAAALGRENDTVRIVALRSLRRFGVPCRAEELARLLAVPNRAVRLEVLETLKYLPDEALLSRLFEVVEQGSDEESRKACEALGRFPLAKVRAFAGALARSRDPLLRRRCAVLLGRLNECGGSAGIDLLFHDEETGVRKEAVRAVGLQRLRSAVPLLRLALGDPEDEVREAAVMAAAEFGEPVLLQEIVAMLGCGSELIDYAVIRGVGMMGAPEAGAALIEYLCNGKVSREIAYALIETLGKISCKEASALVSSRYLKHADPDFRRLAVATLGNLGDRESLKGVEEAVCDPHWSVRIAALHVLGKMGGARELPLLLEGMKDPDPMVRKHAIIILGTLRNANTVPELVHQLTDMEMSRHAFEALLRFGRSALPWLHRLMKKDYPIELRERVVDLIGKIGDRKSVEPLMDLLDDRSPTIRLAAIDSLAYCYDTVPLKKLMQVRRNDANDEVRSRADLAFRTFTMEKYS